MKQTTYARVLTIAGSDSGGGAGIQADLKTFSALGCYGMSVITALTAQNTQGVQAIFDVDPEFVRAQIDAVMQDIGADVVKIGMLHTPEIIEVVADAIQRYKIGLVVLDPVMVAKSGNRLLQDRAVETLRKTLIPLSFIMTPNLEEASVLLNRPIEKREQMEQAAIELLRVGPAAVLVKGGHLKGEGSSDCLAIFNMLGPPHIKWFESRHIATPNTHGTGCTYASAIAAYLALGNEIPAAVRKAKNYIMRAIEAGSHYQLGKGHGPVMHFHALWPKIAEH